MTTEEMLQKSSDARKAAKELQKKLQTITDPQERKEMARQMNDLFNQASQLKDEAKNRHRYEASIAREFNSMPADLEDD